MKLIVGLGNPGKKYSKTRHNVGFIILDEIIKSYSIKWENKAKFKCDFAQLESGDIFIKPNTYMNKSGESVSRVASFYKIKLEDIVVIHDVVDLDFGRIKKQFGVRIDENILKEWQNFCSRNGLKMSVHVAKALKNYINYYEGMLKSGREKYLKK